MNLNPLSFSWTHQKMSVISLFFLKKVYHFFSLQSHPLLFLLDPLYPPLLCMFSAILVTFGSCISIVASSIRIFFYDSIYQHLDSHRQWVHLYDPLLRRQTFYCWQSQLDVSLKSISSFSPSSPSIFLSLSLISPDY